MLSWIATPGSASVHVDLMQAQVPDATTLAKMRHSLKARGVRQGLCFAPELRTREGRDHGAGWLHCGRDFHLSLKLHEEQGPRTRPLRRTSPRKTCYLKSRGKPKIFDRNLEK